MSVRQGGRYRLDPATGERQRIEDAPIATPAPAPVEPKSEPPAAPAETPAEPNPSRERKRDSRKSEE